MFRKYNKIIVFISIIVAIFYFRIVTVEEELFSEIKGVTNVLLLENIKNDPLLLKKREKDIKLISESERKDDNIRQPTRKEISYLRITKYPHYKSKDKFRICFGSCNVSPKNRSIWQNISSYQPDLWIFLGDNYYNDYNLVKDEWIIDNESIITNHFEVINQMKDNISFKKFLKEHKYLAIWDDHDYYKNNSDFNVNPELQDLLKKSFLNFFKVPKSDIRYERNGIYTYYDLEINGVNMVRFFLLDIRTNKSNLDILGKEQWTWLEENLKNSPADINFLISGTVFIGKKDIDYESWEKTGWSFKKLEELLRINNIKNVILISGDIHQGRTVIRNHLIEFTSSSLTSKIFKDEIIIDSHTSLTKNNFGFIDIDYSNLDTPVFTGGLINFNDGKNSHLIKFEAK